MQVFRFSGTFAARMTQNNKAFIQLHLSVMLAGFTGLFGKLITLSEVDITWYRMLFTALILLVFTGLPRVSRRQLWHLVVCGALLGLHWMLFYGSIKASNVSIGVVCYALVGFFTAMIEPLVLHRRFRWVEIGFSMITLLGLVCIFSFDARYRMGIAIGAVSSLVAALFSVLNKKYTVDIKSRTAIFYEMSGGIVVLTMIIPIYMALLHVPFSSVLVVPSGMNLWWMLCHALFCTVGLYMLQIQALRVLSAFTVNLTYNLEPCYTILMAFIFFGEGRDFNFSFYVGIALVILSVSLQTVRALRGKKG